MLKPHQHTLFDLYAEGSRNWWAGRDLYAGGLPLGGLLFLVWLVGRPWSSRPRGDELR